jgi:hypothetical protein
MGLLEALRRTVPAELLAMLEQETERTDVGLIRVGLAEMSITSPAATTTDQEPNFTKIAGTYGPGFLNGFTHLNGILTLTDPETRIFQIGAAITAVASVNDTYAFCLAVSGVPATETEQRRLISGVSDVGSISIMGCLQMGPGDTIEIQVAREGAAPANCTVQRLHLHMTAVT